MGYSPQVHKEPDVTEQLNNNTMYRLHAKDFHASSPLIPIQYSEGPSTVPIKETR